MVTKRDDVVPEMKERLLQNRSGDLTVGQWVDIVFQPLTPILLMLLPASLLLLPRLVRLFVRGGWIFLLLVVVFITLSFVFRAYRYARAPVHYGELLARDDSPPFWMFWRPNVLYTADDEQVTFTSRLAPRPILRRNHVYMVYYLKDHDQNVLLSIGPSNHPDAEKWQPDTQFEARFKRRSRT